MLYALLRHFHRVHYLIIICQIFIAGAAPPPAFIQGFRLLSL